MFHKQLQFLPQLMDYILQRIKTLNEFCVICDERHVFDCALLKVSTTIQWLLYVLYIPHSLVCVPELCAYSHSKHLV